MSPATLTGASHGIARIVALLAVLLLVPATATAATPGTGRLAGTITDELGRPLPGVDVRVDLIVKVSEMGSEQRPTGEPATSDAAGRWAIEDLPPGTTYYLWFRKDRYSYGPSWESPRDIVVEAGRTTTKDVFMVEQSAGARGRIVDVAGRPVQGVSVRESTGGGDLGVSGPDGRFSGTITPGDHTYGAQDQRGRYRPVWDLGWQDPRSPRYSVERGETVDLGDVVVRRWGAEPCWTEDGEWWDREPFTSFPRSPQSPRLFPREEHLCPDVEASELPALEPARGFRVGIPAPIVPVVPAPALREPTPVAPAPPVAGALAAPRRVAVAGGRFEVRSTCTASCAGRIVAVVRRRSSTRSRAGELVVGRVAVVAGAGPRRHRVVLTAAGRRLVARHRSGVVVDLRWDAPGAAKDRPGPRVRLVARR